MEAKQQRKRVEMWINVKHQDNIIQSKPPQKKCTGLKKHFDSHFNPDQTKLKLSTKIEHTPLYISSYAFFPNVNNNKPTDKEVENVIKKS